MGGDDRIKFGPGEDDYGKLFDKEFGENEIDEMMKLLSEVEYRGEESGILRIGRGSSLRTRTNSFAGGGSPNGAAAGPARPRVRFGKSGSGFRGQVPGSGQISGGKLANLGSGSSGLVKGSAKSANKSKVRVSGKGASSAALSGFVTAASIIASASSSGRSRNDDDGDNDSSALNDLVSQGPEKAYDALKELVERAKNISSTAKSKAASQGASSYATHLKGEAIRKINELKSTFKTIHSSLNTVIDVAETTGGGTVGGGVGSGGAFGTAAGGSAGTVGASGSAAGGVTVGGTAASGAGSAAAGGVSVAGGGAAAGGAVAGGTAASGTAAVGAAGAAGGTAAAGGVAAGGAAAGGSAAAGATAGALGSNPVGWAIAGAIAVCCACIGVVVFFLASCSSASMIQGIGDSFSNGYAGVGTVIGTPNSYEGALEPNIPSDNGYLAITAMYRDYRAYNDEFRAQLAKEVKAVLIPGPGISGCNYSYPDNADVYKYNIVINNYYNEELISKDSLGVFDAAESSADDLLFRFSPKPPDFRQIVGIYYSLFETRMEKATYEQIYSSKEIVSPWTKNKIATDKITMKRLIDCLAKHEIKVTQKSATSFNHGSHTHKVVDYDVDVNIYIYDAVRVKGKDYTIAGEGNDFSATDVYEFADPTRKGLLPDDVSLRENLKDYISEVDLVVENGESPLSTPQKYITDYPKFELGKDGSFTMPSEAAGFDDSAFSGSVSGTRFLLLAISLQRRASTLNDSVSQSLTESNDWTTQYDSVNMVWPTKSTQILNAFGMRTTAGEANYHIGMDISDNADATVRAIADGTVIYSGFDSGGYGFCVIIEHKTTKGEVWYSLYGHCNMILIPEAYKDIDGNTIYTTVTKGQKIALLGNTGYTSQPNLHLEIRTFKNAPENAVNPEFLFLNPGGTLPSAVPIPVDLPVFP